jgi:hypothetical protein
LFTLGDLTAFPTTPLLLPLLFVDETKLVFLLMDVFLLTVDKSMDSLVGKRDLRGLAAIATAPAPLFCLLKRTASLQLLERRLSAMFDAALLEGNTFFFNLKYLKKRMMT